MKNQQYISRLLETKKYLLGELVKYITTPEALRIAEQLTAEIKILENELKKVRKEGD